MGACPVFCVDSRFVRPARDREKAARSTFGPSVEKDYDVIGEPTTVEDAWELAQSDPYQFQFWALGLVGARPHEEKKGAPGG
jgi:hypothetical protein